MPSSRPSHYTLTAAGHVRLYDTVELITLPPPTWLVDTIVPAGGFSVLYAPPGLGKTFVAMDISLSVAAGIAWAGHTTVRGYVMYISAEGGAGIGKRAAAWLQDREVEATEARVAWLIESVVVSDTSSGLETLIHRIDTEVLRRPDLIVIDTLARCFEGDENTQEDMGRFVAGVDMLRARYDAAALVVHHTRLDGDRERGNTALRGAADMMCYLTDSGATKSGARRIKLQCDKMKDAVDFEPVTLTLDPIAGTDSAVIHPVTGGRPSFMEQRKQRILKLLRGGSETFSGIQTRTLIPKASLHRTLSELELSGLVSMTYGDHYTLSSTTEQ